MKKTFIFITLVFISTFLWCQDLELKSVKQFSNTKEFKIVHDYELDSYNGKTGNRMFCDNKGSILFTMMIKIFFMNWIQKHSK